VSAAIEGKSQQRADACFGQVRLGISHRDLS